MIWNKFWDTFWQVQCCSFFFLFSSWMFNQTQAKQTNKAPIFLITSHQCLQNSTTQSPSSSSSTWVHLFLAPQQLESTGEPQHPILSHQTRLLSSWKPMASPKSSFSMQMLVFLKPFLATMLMLLLAFLIQCFMASTPLLRLLRIGFMIMWLDLFLRGLGGCVFGMALFD